MFGFCGVVVLVVGVNVCVHGPWVNFWLQSIVCFHSTTGFIDVFLLVRAQALIVFVKHHLYVKVGKGSKLLSLFGVDQNKIPQKEINSFFIQNLQNRQGTLSER